jgi:7-carboxy-7-deazaguanine synthase
MKNLKINEIFKSFQGEGFHTGKSAIFIRLGGCNLWDNNESSRISNKFCGKWCDTDFSTKKSLSVSSLLKEVSLLGKTRLLIFTGGEPYLQLTQELLNIFKEVYPEVLICIETNGTLNKNFSGVWVTCSPKENTTIVLKEVDEIKLVVPQETYPKEFPTAKHYFVQPKNSLVNLDAALNYMENNLDYRLSVQLHKLVGAR